MDYRFKASKNPRAEQSPGSDRVVGVILAVARTGEVGDDKIFISLGCCTIICPIDDKENKSVGTIDPNFGEYYKDKKQYGALIFDYLITPQVFTVKKLMILEMK